ncbi:MAG: DUF523 domain-containing protein [Coprobacillus sp.]|nr:DUF523 domain-containing protein [Coprobacillus sp.]
MKKEKILISACLVGDKVKYDGTSNKLDSLDLLLDKYDLVPFCPEIEGGLNIPRTPAEINGDKVINQKGKDVTDHYNEGASKALLLCEYLGIQKAILKEKSPSCGVHQIYDGSFTHKVIKGEGITTRLLKSKGIEVYSEDEIDLLL